MVSKPHHVGTTISTVMRKLAQPRARPGGGAINLSKGSSLHPLHGLRRGKDRDHVLLLEVLVVADDGINAASCQRRLELNSILQVGPAAVDATDQFGPIYTGAMTRIRRSRFRSDNTAVMSCPALRKEYRPFMMEIDETTSSTPPRAAFFTNRFAP